MLALFILNLLFEQIIGAIKVYSWNMFLVVILTLDADSNIIIIIIFFFMESDAVASVITIVFI